MRRLWSNAGRLLTRRVKVPLVPLRVPLLVLLLLGGVVVGVPTGAAVVVATNQPMFCNSCHEMSLHYATWRQSSHSEVTCEECHLMPGTMNMLKGKIAAFRQVRLHVEKDVKPSIIQGHVPDENCRNCHPTTRKLVAYHGLKITHRDHWDMGLDCTFCHDRVAHGPRWQFEGVSTEEQLTQATTPSKYAPSMEKCYTCHDGEKASNKCSTCHVTLGERRPRAFDPEWVAAHREEVQHAGLQDCRRCHQDTFCDRCHREANPHRADWVPTHPEEARDNPERCFTCHVAPGEAQTTNATDLAFCRACHSLRREHSGTDWTQRHGQEALTDATSCTQCHDQSWCSDCHSLTRSHPAEWRIRHVADASRDRSGCAVCHTADFCGACHRGKKGTPDSHDIDWLSRHKYDAGRGEESCRVCHESDFCRACHVERAPMNHDSHWLAKHGAESTEEQSACLLCHDDEDCSQCHGMTMPHPKLWLASHHKPAAENREQCERCHRRDACDICHRGAFPDSHLPADWADGHGAAAQQEGAECYLCHREALCDSCHGLTMPHPAAWEATSHGDAVQRDKATCWRCHSEEQCQACHGLAMPHPGDWVGRHGTEANASPGACLSCHGVDSHDCTVCHKALTPSDHREAQWGQEHGVAGASKTELCTLCHGKRACVECHEGSAGAA